MLEKISSYKENENIVFISPRYYKFFDSLKYTLGDVIKIKELKNKVGRMSDLESTFAQGW